MLRTDPKLKSSAKAAGIVLAAVTAVTVYALTGRASAMSQGPHHSFLAGPWELVVKMGMEGEGLRLPITVSDENKPHKFDNLLPVTGTPIRIRLNEYVPNLTWETAAVKHPGGGTVAELTIKGKGLEQKIWLSSGEMSKQSMSSRIGGVAIKRLSDPKTAEKLVRELRDPRAIGIISVWSADGSSQFEYAAKIAKTTSVPKSRYKLTVLEYVPHYSIDVETKKVVSLSDKPINPAVKIACNDGTATIEQWLWAKFPASPHKQTKFPVRMRFTDFDLGDTTGRYILVTAPQSRPWLLFSNKGKRRAERAVLGKSYPFAGTEYSFRIDSMIDEAIIRTEWKNKSEILLRPAIIATIEQGGAGGQAVLELGKPFHHKTELGTLVLLYRRSPMPPESID
ncbi:MAG: hypothetical protein ACYSUD_05375 [Planctomycetota bacterium]|jgi:hypothetical protein